MTVSEKLRLVHGLHYHAEIFGFNWDDGSDWTWHDVACKIADEVDAENAKLRMRVTSLESALEGMHLIREMDVAENAKLREERNHWHVEQVHAYSNWEDAHKRATELELENTKLHELCKDMMAFVEDDDACEHCGHDAECVEAADGELVLPYEGRCLMLDLFADRIRELGAEVMHE